MQTEMIEHGVVCVLLLLLCISISNARLTGASNTSCYNHVINHRTILQMYDVQSCSSSNLCTDIVLHVSCPMQDNLVCCRDFTSTPLKTLYTQCNYTFSFTPTTNLGFLVQAREVEPSELYSPTFNVSSSIIGTWDSGPDHQQLWCKTSIQSVNESTVPNSVTHTGAYRADDINAPSSINMTWYANTTTPNSDTERSSIYITFFYTISRDLSTNFYPYTTSNLTFQLLAKPSSINTSNTDTGSSGEHENDDITTKLSNVYTFNECPSKQAKEVIMEDVIMFLSLEFGISRVGLTRSSAASSCEEALHAHPSGQGFLYWIINGNVTEQQYC